MGCAMTEDLSAFIQPGRVHRQIYTDPAIFELELERIFGVAWIYVGHESQVKNPGDYFRTFIGRKPVVLVRDAGGQIRVIQINAPIAARWWSPTTWATRRNSSAAITAGPIISTAGSSGYRCSTAIPKISIRTIRRPR